MKRTLRTVAVLTLAGIVISSCASLKKMKKMEKNIAYKVTPEVLEAKGGNVDVKIDATIPAKYFNRKVTLVATPVLKFQNGGEKAYEPKTFQGEKVQGNNEVVPYASGKTVSYTGSVPFEEAMRVSGLYVKFVGSKGAKSVDYESRKIADGVLATSTMVENTPAAAIGADQFQRITKEEQEAAIYYLINSAQIRTKEMTSKEIKAMEKFIKDAKAAEDMVLKNIQIQSYASPDGPVSLNEKLADNREGAADKFMKNNMKKIKVDEYKNLDFFKKYVVAEDWEGFKKAMEESRLGIPIIFGYDAIHGFRTVYPISLAQACSWTPGLVEQACAVSAQEARMSGVDWTFSPMIDVARDPRWGRVAEGYGEDPYANGVFGAACVRGYQGDKMSAENRVAACR